MPPSSVTSPQQSIALRAGSLQKQPAPALPFGPCSALCSLLVLILGSQCVAGAEDDRLIGWKGEQALAQREPVSTLCCHTEALCTQ